MSLSIDIPTIQCPLCYSIDIDHQLQGLDQRAYYKCANCKLIYVDPNTFLRPEAEKARYDLHINNENDPKYIRFLSQAIDPSLTYLKPKGRILDFGCGPSKALLSEIRRNIDCQTIAYDPYYYPIELDQLNPFDAIYSTETFEHFFLPHLTIGKIITLLVDDGVLIVMTEFYPQDVREFPKWYYAKDPTHVVFYSMETFTYIESFFHLERLFTDNNRVIIWRKKK